ncbi:MAG: glycosyltransferase family 4 protein [Chloroflexia bacterium]
MRVGIVTTAGVTHQFRQWPEAILGRALVARGHKVAAFTMLEEGSDITGQAREDVDGIDTYRVKVYKPWVAPGLLAPLIRFRPDVIHLFHLRNALNWQAVLLARLLRVPVVFTVVGPFHDPYLVEDRERPYLGKMYPRRLIYSPRTLLKRLIAARFRKPLSIWQNFCMHFPLRAADRLIALSRHEVAVLRVLGLDEGRRTEVDDGRWTMDDGRPSDSKSAIRNPQSKIVLIPLWIDVPYIRSIPYGPSLAQEYPPPHVLFLGQLKERKGYDTLAQAMPLVLKKCPTATFLFAGQNPARAEHLLAICRENGSDGHLALLGRVSEEEKVRLMRGSDCLVYPTRYESFGLPPLEAMAASCPVVATRLPVVSEMIQDGENGVLVEPENPQSLADGIVRVLTDPALRARLVAGGQRALARYDESRIIAEIEALYSSLL